MFITIIPLVSRRDDKFISRLIEEGVIESVASVFDENEDEKVQVCLKITFFVSLLFI